MQPERERGHHSEVPAPAVQGPEQLRVVIFAGANPAAVCGDEFVGHHVVTCEAELAIEPAPAAPKSEACHPGRRYSTACCRQPVRLGCAVEVAHRGTPGHGRDARLRIDRHRVHPPQIDDQTSVRDGHAGDTMPAAPDRELEVELSSEANRPGHVLHVLALRNDGRAPIDHRVEDASGPVVDEIARQDDLTREAAAELFHPGVVQRRRSHRPNRVLPHVIVLLRGGPRRHRAVDPASSTCTRPAETLHPAWSDQVSPWASRPYDRLAGRRGGARCNSGSSEGRW